MLGARRDGHMAGGAPTPPLSVAWHLSPLRLGCLVDASRMQVEVSCDVGRPGIVAGCKASTAQGGVVFARAANP
jgi:hypothetical protein